MISCASLTYAILLGSAHINADRQYDYNPFNPGIITECDGFTAGAFRNSFSKTAIFAGYHAEIDYGFGVMLALSTGYPHPIIGGITWKYKHIQLIYVPKIVKEQHATTIAVAYRF